MKITINERIAIMRKRAGLSQTEFAEKIGSTQNTLSRIESGARKPSIETLERIADFFNCEIGFLERGGE